MPFTYIEGSYSKLWIRIKYEIKEERIVLLNIALHNIVAQIAPCGLMNNPVKA